MIFRCTSNVKFQIYNSCVISTCLVTLEVSVSVENSSSVYIVVDCDSMSCKSSIDMKNMSIHS